MVPSKSRLSKTKFLQKALDVLASEGPRSLTAARMARELKVTTGSFYWHFDCVEIFHRDLKTFWRDHIVVGIIDEAREQTEDASKVLGKIGEIIRRRGTYRYDVAMRAWAKTDRAAEEMVRSADALRGDLIAGVLRDAGASPEQARDKSNLVRAAWLGSQELSDTEYRFKLMGMAIEDQADQP